MNNKMREESERYTKMAVGLVSAQHHDRIAELEAAVARLEGALRTVCEHGALAYIGKHLSRAQREYHNATTEDARRSWKEASESTLSDLAAITKAIALVFD